MLLILLLFEYAVTVDVVVDPYYQEHAIPDGAVDTYGWFVEALMSLTLVEETTIYLAAGTHYVQTNYGESPFLTGEPACEMNYPEADGPEQPPEPDDDTLYRRRNPLRYMMHHEDEPLFDSVYGANFKITVKTMRCSEMNLVRCVSDSEDPAKLSWSNPFVTFEVLDEFTLEDLELTGYESLAKGCRWEDCTWWQPYSYVDASECGVSKETNAENWSSYWNVISDRESDDPACVDSCNGSGCYQSGEIDREKGMRDTFPICCSCGLPEGDDYICNDKWSIMRCENLDECSNWWPPEEEPSDCPACCTESMKTNDKCESECNFAACNYGNYYRCFPLNQDYVTDCDKLHNTSLFKIGDRAYISHHNEARFTGAPPGHRADDNYELYWDVFEGFGMADHDPRFILDCGQYPELLTNGKGRLTLRNVKVSYFQQEYSHLFEFHGRDYTQEMVDKTYICHPETGLELDNVEFEKIRTNGPIIYSPIVQDKDALYSDDSAENVGLPGKLILTDVSFKEINTVVPFTYTQTHDVMMPGIMYIYDFGFIEITRVTIEKAAFESNYEGEEEEGDDDDDDDEVDPNAYATAFYFNYVQELKIDTLTISKLNLRAPLFVLENLTRSMDWNDEEYKQEFFINVPCKRIQFPYYKNCDVANCQQDEIEEFASWRECWKGDYVDYGEGDKLRMLETSPINNRRLQPPDGGPPDEEEAFDYCWKQADNDRWVNNDNGINPVVINNVSITDVYFPSGLFAEEKGMSTMIEFIPLGQNSAHYSYTLTNWNMERIYDFSNQGKLVEITSRGGGDQEASKFVKNPPGILIENWNIDTVFKHTLMKFKPSAPTIINNLTVKNHLAYDGNNPEESEQTYNASPIFMIYPDFQLGFEIDHYNNTILPKRTVEIEYEIRDPLINKLYDTLKPEDSFQITNSVFENCEVSTNVVYVHDHVQHLIEASDLTFKECEWLTDDECVLYETSLTAPPGGVTYSNFVFTDNVDYSGATTATFLIKFVSSNYENSVLTIDNFTVTGNTDFRGGIKYEYVKIATIRDSIFSNNVCDRGALTLRQHQDTHDLSILNSDFLDNFSHEQSVVIIASAIHLKLTIRDWEFKRNTSNPIGLESITELDNSSTITNVKFADNEDVTQGGDIFIGMNSGKLTIRNCEFSNSKAPLGSSIYWIPSAFGISEPSSIEEIDINNLEVWPEIHIISCKFENFPESEAAIIFIDSITYALIYSENLIVKNNKSPLAQVKHAGYIDEGSQITFNDAASIFNMEIKSDLKVHSTSFEYNTVEDGVIQGQLARIQVSDSSFQHNLSRQSSGCLFFYKILQATIQDTIFVNNTATQYGSVMFASDQAVKNTVPIVFENCTFERNHADSLAGLQLTFANMRISHNSNFYANTAAGYPGIYLFYSSADIVDSYFHDQTSAEAAFLRSIYSDVNITRSTFSNAYGHSSSIMKISDESVLIVKESVFEHSYSGYGAIHVELNSYVQLIDTIIQYMHSDDGCSFACIDRSVVEIENWQMLHSNLTMITANSFTDLIISNTIFSNSTTKHDGGFLNLDHSNFIIENSEFDKSLAKKGGAIYYTSEFAPLAGGQTILNSKFTNNQATDGGALYLQNDITKIDGWTFDSNIASGDGLRAEGEGGAIFYHCTSDCKLNITDTKFENNIAEGAGGSISWDSFLPNIDDSSEFTNNTAKYGSDISSPPAQISYLVSQAIIPTRRLETNSAALEDSLTGIASGQDNSLNLTFGILDYYGQIVKSNTIYTANLISGAGTELRGTLSVDSVNGLFIFDDLIVINDPGTTASISITTDAIPEDLGVTSNSEIDFSFYVRECDVGEELSDGQCLVCDSNGQKYTFEAAAKECEDCPSEAICLGGHEVYPKKGYWRSGWNSTNFYECPIEIACLGGNNTKNYKGECDEDLGYSGRMCTVWKENFTRLARYEWSKCPEEFENAFILVGLLFCVLGLIGFIIRSNLLAASQRRREITGVYIKIMTNYMQIITLVNSFKLDWPEFVLDYFEGQEKVSGASDRVFSFDCWLQKFDGAVFYSNLIIVVMIPVVIIVLSTVIWSIQGFLAGDLQRAIAVKNKAWILVAFFLIHPNLIKVVFTCFSCQEIDDGLYLDIDMSQECWTGDHIYYSILVALPALIVWGIGLPLLAIFMLGRHYRNDTIFEVHTLSIYGFLYNGYRRTHYYWEIIILYRKVLIVFVSVFLSMVSIEVQALVALFIMIIALVYHNKEHPFDKLNLNQLESKSIIAASITIYCGLYYLSGSLSEPTKVAFFAVIILVNVHFFITWCITFADAFQTKLKTSNFALFSRLFGKCMSEHKVLKIRDIVGPQYKHTVAKDKELVRRKFLDKEFAGDYAYSDTVTKKQFVEMVKDKGLMLYEILKESETKAPSFEQTTRKNEDQYSYSLPVGHPVKCKRVPMKTSGYVTIPKYF